MLLGLAPMDGFTDCAFRQITKEIFDQYGEKEKYTLQLRTEFMNADGYIINPLGVVKHLLTSKEQAPVIAQIFGANEAMLVKCFAEIEEKYGNIFTGIELNMGCPARNVMNTGGGSALLKDRKNTLDILKHLRKTISCPLSFKTRTGIDQEDREAQMKFLIEASKYVDMITIHGRTVKQGYAGESDWEFIYKFRNEVQGERDKNQGPKSSSQNKVCKILGNGGIKSYEDIGKFLYGNSEQSEEYTSYSDFDFHEATEYIRKEGLISDGKYLPYDPLLKERAGSLRKNMTSAEKKIRNDYLKSLDVNIMRQKIIDHYIVDFYIPSRKLVIEIDGDTHFNEEAEGYDATRTEVLEAYGLEVIRFTNDDVYNNFEAVCETLGNKITSTKYKSPPPSLAKREPNFTVSFAKGGVEGNETEDFLLDGVMIGQAAIGNPRIFTPHIPSREEIKDTILKHLDYMISYENFFQEQKARYTGVLTMPDNIKMNVKNIQTITLAEFRKHLFQYVKGIPGSKEFKQKVSTIVDYKQLVEEIQKFFE